MDSFIHGGTNQCGERGEKGEQESHFRLSVISDFIHRSITLEDTGNIEDNLHAMSLEIQEKINRKNE